MYIIIYIYMYINNSLIIILQWQLHKSIYKDFVSVRIMQLRLCCSK